jgi:hypothetical protein
VGVYYRLVSVDFKKRVNILAAFEGNSSYIRSSKSIKKPVENGVNFPTY